MNADGRRARAVVDTLPGHGCKPLCGACKATLDGAIAAVLAAERRRALLGLARWALAARPKIVRGAAADAATMMLDMVASEARRRARGSR